MADDAWQSLPDIDDATGLPMEGVNFFQLLRRLERSGQYFGEAGPPDKEPARLGQHVRQTFAIKDVAEFTPAKDNKPAKVSVMNFGLMGPEGPMPLHLTRWTLDRLSQRWFSESAEGATSDTTFVDFANMAQHRMISLFYRAWSDTRPEVQIERNDKGRIRIMLGALGGIGLPGMEGLEPELDAIKLRQAGSLAHQVQGPERLTHFLSDAVGAPVALKEFVGEWVDIPAHLQSSTGRKGQYNALGVTASIGPRSFQRQARVEIRVGPISLEDFSDFLPGGRKLDIIRKSVLYVVGQNLTVDMRLVLKRDEVPEPKLGGIRLGQTSWLGETGEDRDDYRMSGVVGRLAA